MKILHKIGYSYQTNQFICTLIPTKHHFALIKYDSRKTNKLNNYRTNVLNSRDARRLRWRWRMMTLHHVEFRWTSIQVPLISPTHTTRSKSFTKRSPCIRIYFVQFDFIHFKRQPLPLLFSLLRSIRNTSLIFVLNSIHFPYFNMLKWMR